MSSSKANMSVKELQKQARQAISTKAYKEAIDCCKEALKLDKDNYVTLVLFGAASFNEEGYQQAEKAYQKAISIDRKNPLAWKVYSSKKKEKGKYS